ncbi:MAG: SRPBCC family protein [Gammaproteobacteria bacterium]
MTVVLVALAIILAAALIWLAALDGTFSVRRSSVIAVEPIQAYDLVRDFHHWPAWSPWLIHEPDARLNFSSDPQEPQGWYSWDGKHIGAGKLTHEAMSAPTRDRPGRIEQRLSFTRPFRSSSRVVWDFSTVTSGSNGGVHGGVEVSWTMQGAMPFPLRFLAPMTARMITRDFDLGLARLKGVLDPAAAAPRIHFDGPSRFPSKTCITLPFEGDLDDIQQTMIDGFPRLAAQRAALKAPQDEPAFTAYHKVLPDRPWFKGDLATPIPEDADPGPFRAKTLGGEGDWFRVRLEGSYRFLEMTWHCAMAHLRMHKIRRDPRRSAFEVYESTPGDGDDGGAVTVLYIPIKS